MEQGNRRAGREAGFTLVEVMMAVAVFSSLVLMAVPRFTNVQESLTMKATARNMATNFRLAQQRASAANGTCYVELDLGHNSFTIWLDGDRDGVYDQGEEVRPVGLSEEASAQSGVKLSKEVVFESTTWTGASGPRVAFSSDGSVSSAGEVVLRDGDGRRYKVTVTLAGGISVLQSLGGSWVE